MNIEYRDISTYYPRKKKQVEARLGDFSARGKNKTEAKAALLAQIEEQSSHMFERRYLIGPKATFALYFNGGWFYDIIPMEQPEWHSTGARYSGCGLEAENISDAYWKMARHFDQYHEVA